MEQHLPRISAIAALVTFAITISSCGGDSTAPKSGLVVTLTADSPAPDPVISDTPNGPKILCNIGLTATATGKGTAAWSGATTYWYVGLDRTTAIDTTQFASDEVVQGFMGQGGISAGQTLHTIWYFYNEVPFDLKVGFAYQTDAGKSDIAWTRFRCGPDPATAVTPTITQISLPATTGLIKPGDTVSVTYQEASTSGVWLSIIDISGSFLAEQVLGEHLTTNVNRTVQFIVPPQLHSNVPLTVSVQAYDAALKGRAQSLETQLKYVDSTPPVMSSVSIPTGQYAVGDTLEFRAYAQDDNLLGWLVYQLGPPANFTDSASALPNHAWDDIIAEVPVRAAWVGQPAVSVAVHDAAGLTSPTQSSPAGALTIYPEVDLPTTAPLQISNDAASDDMVYDEKRDLMYVAVPVDNHIAVFSPSTMTAQAPIALPGAPGGMDLSLSGDSLLVAVPSANAIEVIDLAHPSTTPTAIHLSALDTVASAVAGGTLLPSDLRIAANGKMFVFLSWQSQQGDQVVEVDLTTGKQRIRTDARELATVYPFWTTFVGRARNRSRIYTFGPCRTYYDATTDSFAPCVVSNQLPLTQGGVTADAIGSQVSAGAFVFAADLSAGQSAGIIRNRGANVALSPDGATAYLADGRSVRGEHLADLTQFERIPIPLASDRAFVDPNGKWILAFQTTAPARVTRVDLP